MIYNIADVDGRPALEKAVPVVGGVAAKLTSKGPMAQLLPTTPVDSLDYYKEQIQMYVTLESIFYLFYHSRYG